MLKSADLVAQLSGVPLFAGCSPESLATLAAVCRTRSAPKGTTVFYQGDPSDALYVTRRGSVTIVLTHPDGRDLVINEMHAGDCFGELGLITGRPRSSAAIARTDAELLIVPGDAFRRLLAEEPSVQRRLLQTTAERLSTSGEREGALAFLDAPARLARVLLQLDALSDDGYVTISQAEMADRTGLTRQTVAKVLGRWRRAGWLITGRGRVMLLNRDVLGRLAAQV